MITPPDSLSEVTNMALVDMEYPGDLINDTAEFVLVMRRQTIEGEDEVITYASDNMGAVTIQGMLSVAQYQLLTDLSYDNYDDE